MTNVFDGLQRRWVFPIIDGYRGAERAGTYNTFDLDAQPKIAELDGGLEWLRSAPPAPDWAITQDDDGVHSNELSLAKLRGLEVDEAWIDPALILFASSPDLQRKIRSATGCFLQLGDVAVPLANGEGSFIHVLSDQQWVGHWLVYCAPGAASTVISCGPPYGFDLEGDWYGEPLPRQLGPTELEQALVVADSFEEFLYRYWVENELFFHVIDGGDVPPDPRVAAYAARLSA